MSRGNGQRGTKAEKARSVHKVYKMLVDGVDVRGIVIAAEQLGWDVSSRTIDTYVVEARKLLEAESAEERLLELGRAKARLHSIYGRSLVKKDLRLALDVQREFNKLFGLYAPTRVESSGPGGKPIQIQEVPLDLSMLTDEELAALEAIRVKLTNG
jgi:predicted ATP-grasp superfamily ATP-dependent carboligase